MVERRAAIAELSARAYADACVASAREENESRVQASEQIVKAYAAMCVAAEREVTEARVQTCALEAKMYAAQGLRTQGAALRAIGKVVAEIIKDNKRLSRTCETLSARLEACEGTIRDLRREHGLAPRGARNGGSNFHDLGDDG